MKLTELQRENLIHALVDDWIGTLMSDRGSTEYFVREWLTEGRIGYNEHDDQELIDLAEDADIDLKEILNAEA